jgi:hypothetical protein
LAALEHVTEQLFGLAAIEEVLLVVAFIRITRRRDAVDTQLRDGIKKAATRSACAV